MNLKQRIQEKIQGLFLRSAPHQAKQNIYVDVTNIARNDLNTGIERVVKSYITCLRAMPEFNLIPVILTAEGGWQYLQWSNFLGTQTYKNDTVQFLPGDLLWCLDFNPHQVTQAHDSGFYENIKTTGVRLVFQVYDILPITHAQFFPPGADEVHTQWMKRLCTIADDLICISQAVSSSIQSWAKSQNIAIKPRLHAVHLGANLPKTDTHANTPHTLDVSHPQNYLLSVGTIEPRKGHDQALDAFEQLWTEGSNLGYVIAGQEGWKGVPPQNRQYIEKLSNRIRQHQEFGKKLWWYENAADSTLTELYRKATGVLVPSREEGYGLPLIEAAQYGAPLLVRDIPVFREIAGGYASYFTGDSPTSLRTSIKEWERSLKLQTAVRSEQLPRASWSQSLNAVLNSLGLK